MIVTTIEFETYNAGGNYRRGQIYHHGGKIWFEVRDKEQKTVERLEVNLEFLIAFQHLIALEKSKQ